MSRHSARTRVLLAAALTGLLLLTPAFQAEPGGQGNENRDFDCGSSCHGDPAFSTESSATVTLALDQELAYTGATVSVTVTVEDMELSARRLVGVMLLSSLNGVDDHPSEDGWRIVQDPAGTRFNYVELVGLSSDRPLEFQWVLEVPETVGAHTLFARVHHGADPNPSELARSTTNSTGLTIPVTPPPANLPELGEWAPPEVALLGETTSLRIEPANATDVQLWWRTESDGSYRRGTISNVSTDGSAVWEADLPAVLRETNLSYRFVLINPQFEVVTPSLRLSAEAPRFETDGTALLLQSWAGAFAVIAGLLAVQRAVGRRAFAPAAPADPRNQTAAVEQMMANDAVTPTSPSAAPADVDPAQAQWAEWYRSALASGTPQAELDAQWTQQWPDVAPPGGEA